MWKPQKSKDELVKLYKEHINKYLAKYESVDGLLDYMNDSFESYIGSNRVIAEIVQLYDLFGAMSPEENIYLEYLKNIEKAFDIKCNIIEVGGGMIPSLASYIAKKQIELGSGSITVYDPRLIYSSSKYENMKLYPSKFTQEINIDKFDLVLGIMPCSGTTETLKAIEKSKKDFYLALCGCDHHGFYTNGYGFFVPSYHEYIRHAKEIVKNNNMGELVIDYLDDKYEVEYPIIYNKR